MAEAEKIEKVAKVVKTPLTKEQRNRIIRNKNRIKSKLRSTLIEAVKAGDIDTVRECLAKGANPNEVETIGNTVLVLAVWYRHTDVGIALIDAGADPNQGNIHKQTPIGLARGAMPELEKYMADVNEKKNNIAQPNGDVDKYGDR